MKKANVEKLEIMAAGFLQYRYKMWLTFGKRDADWNFYEGACAMIISFGGDWKRHYKGGDTEDEQNSVENYSHTVWFPSDERCAKLNEDAWKE